MDRTEGKTSKDSTRTEHRDKTLYINFTAVPAEYRRSTVKSCSSALSKQDFTFSLLIKKIGVIFFLLNYIGGVYREPGW